MILMLAPPLETARIAVGREPMNRSACPAITVRRAVEALEISWKVTSIPFFLISCAKYATSALEKSTSPASIRLTVTALPDAGALVLSGRADADAATTVTSATRATAIRPPRANIRFMRAPPFPHWIRAATSTLRWRLLQQYLLLSSGYLETSPLI